ncbi:MAG: COX15/CtaA family protein [Betaproteobacteria bacterium]|nr:COX15/CtaA family protein [Betaproteobacteria bacterium]
MLQHNIAGSARRMVAVWLLCCAALVLVMVVVGGVTRLTHSGLSIVEWQPLIGTIPPLSDADWHEQFAKYRLTPEFQKVNFHMDLAGFKSIFWWEYFHRLLGRGIGVVFLLPMLWFLLRRMVDRPLAWRLAGVFVLGGLQGAMGWYMVKSGLVDDPRVSQFRLTAHLGLALLIFVAMLWIALDLLVPRRNSSPARRSMAALAMVAVIFLMSLTGGFVAGIRAGKAYNTFPLMNGHWIPPEIFMLEPWWMNFFYNMATVQFVHRSIAWLLAFAVPLLWWHVLREVTDPRARLACHALLAALAAQIVLGIATLALQVPVALGAAHQGGAVVVLACAVWLAHALRRTM